MQACLERVTAGGLEGEDAVVHGIPSGDSRHRQDAAG